MACALACAAVFAVWYQLGRPIKTPEPDVADDKRLQCVSYTPFVGNQSPYELSRGLRIKPERFDADFAFLARRFGCVRTYAAGGMEGLPPYAEKYGLRLLLGIWINQDPIATQHEIERAVAIAKAYPHLIEAVIVGNETLLRREVTALDLTAYIRQVRAVLPGVLVTYADVWEFWLRHPEVAPEVDFVTIHILPYWEDDPVAIDDAMAHVEGIYKKVQQAFPGKELLIGETGWPSEGRMREGALPSRFNQARFVRGFVRLADEHGWRYNFIEAFDQPWKRMNEGAVGGFWGLYSEGRADKGVLAGAVSNYPDWRRFAWYSIVAVIISFGLVLAWSPAPNRACPWFLAWAVLVAGTVLLVMQARQFALVSRHAGETAWAVLVLGLCAGAYLLLLYVSATGKRIAFLSYCDLARVVRSRTGAASLAAVAGGLQIGILFCVLVIALGLMFDSRYRSFPTYGFIIPAFTYFALSAGSRRPAQEGRVLHRAGYEEFALGVTLVACSLYILWNETVWNGQADLWVALCILLAYPLLRRPLQRPPWRAFAASSWVRLCVSVMGMAWIAALAIRYGLMQSAVAARVCAQTPIPSWCGIRSVLGFLIYFQAFGRASLALAVASHIVRDRRLAISALALAVVALVLYNTNWAGPAFILALWRVMQGRNGQKG